MTDRKQFLEMPIVGPSSELKIDIDVCIASQVKRKREKYEAKIASDAETIASLKAFRLQVAQTVGIVYQADGHADVPGPDEAILGEIERLKREASRVLELEFELAARRASDEDVRTVAEERAVYGATARRLLEAPWLKKGGG